MRRRLMTAAWMLAGAISLMQRADARQPNIVLIVADDLGYADLGFQGGKDIPTPNLDKLAAASVRCTNGYVSGPYCSPTRAGLLTGRYQQRFGHEFNPNEGAMGTGLPTSETTIANRLKSAGYATGLVGKWHLGSRPEFHPQKRGFDDFFGFLGGAHTYFAEETGGILRGREVVRERAYLTDAFARESVEFIERNKTKPFFLMLTFNAVHTPMDATDERLARFASISDPQRRTYAAMLSAMDDAVGRVLDKLTEAGVDEDTLVVFISDNGGPTMPGTTLNASRNDPLRGSKRTTLEGGIRVPFLLRWKGRLPEGTTYERPVIQLDILPTALAAAGVDAPADAKLDGVNLLPYLTGKNDRTPHEALYWRFGAQSAVRKGDWKLVRYDAAIETPGARSAGHSANVTPFRLYDLSKDIGETTDLSDRNPEKVSELKDLWNAWNTANVEPLWGAGDPAARTKARSKAGE